MCQVIMNSPALVSFNAIMRVPSESSPDAEGCHDTLLLQHLLMLPFLLQERELPILLTSADILVTHPVSESNKALECPWMDR